MINIKKGGCHRIIKEVDFPKFEKLGYIKIEEEKPKKKTPKKKTDDE